jgi:hypothetical protein
MDMWVRLVAVSREQRSARDRDRDRGVGHGDRYLVPPIQNRWDKVPVPMSHTPVPPSLLCVVTNRLLYPG